MSDTQARFIFLVGPTGIGKTAVSLEVAQKFGYALVNCDSVQVYKKTDIGTAKPSKAEMNLAPHYLFDYVEPPRALTAADYLNDVTDLFSRERIEKAVFVGGSGFYVQALEKGLYPSSKPSEETKKEIENWIDSDGYLALYKWVQEKDPEFAKKISENDHYRIRRAVEVMKTQNQSMTELKKSMAEKNHSSLPPHKAIKVGLRMEKEKLRPRIEARTDQMLASGFIDEVKQLRAEGLDSWVPMQSVGYKEIQAFLDGEVDEQGLRDLIVTSTMQLIKKQMTWFKRDPDIRWHEPSEKDTLLEFIQQWSRD